VARIGVVGLGYVGLTTAACLAHLGNQVTGADVLEERIAALERDECPIVEDGLPELLEQAHHSGQLRYVLGAQNAAKGAEVVFLCVPTPQSDDGSADLSYLKQAAREIGPVLDPGAIVVNKSTVPVGSTRVVEHALSRSDVSVVSNPEFLREGAAVHDFLEPDRVVIGADDEEAARRLARLFDPLHAPVLVTNPATAETIKYAANAFLATKISFVNAVANLCEAVGANVEEVILGMGLDHRIGTEYLKPGPGWGGSCFPKDTRALVRIAQDAGYDFKLLEGVIEVNDRQYKKVADKAQQLLGRSLNGARITLLGLTYKAGTDDLRCSPALQIARLLSKRGALLTAWDPTVEPGREDPALDMPLAISPSAYSACERAEVVIVATEWDEIKHLDWEKVRDLVSSPRIVDARNLLEPSMMRSLGFHYACIGLR
jgi:UDPglucose 6-dehydrogenase